MDDKTSNYRLVDGVFVSEKTRLLFSEFEKQYLAVREKEGRVLTIEEIKKLPFVEKSNPDYDLWEIRRKNISRFLKYLSEKSKKLNILDVGCGNGFFTNMMAAQGHYVSGLDVNLFELKQAAQAFSGSGIKWYCADIMSEGIPSGKFDIITFVSSFQYFKDPVALLNLCLQMFSEGGEIHIIDSPFYTTQSKKNAAENSLKYYKKMGIEKMADYYHHQEYKILEGFSYEVKYKPGGILKKILQPKDSPFLWVVVRKGK